MTTTEPTLMPLLSAHVKALAKPTGDRKRETALLKEFQPLTGYVRGVVA